MPHRRIPLVGACALLTLAAGCASPAGIDKAGPESGFSEEFKALLKGQPELQEAADLIAAGDCAQALPLLTLYRAEHDKSALADVLLGRAFLGAGDFEKGAHHLKQAWKKEASQPLKEAIRSGARQGAAQLAQQHAARKGLPYPALKSLHQLAAFGDPSWYSPALEEALADFVSKLEKRGDYSFVLAALGVMKRVGIPNSRTLLSEASALIRLGEGEQLRKLLQESPGDLPSPAGRTLFELAQQAETAFRPREAAWLLEEAAKAGCDAPTLQLDLARNLLKSQLREPAATACESYLTAAQGDVRRERFLQVGTLLEKYGPPADAFELFARGGKEFPGAFEFVQAMAALHEKLPEKVDPILLFGKFVEEQQLAREALEKVGETCLEWRLAGPCRTLFQTLAAKGASPALTDHYLGALHWIAGEKAEARQRFDKAVAASQNKAQALDRIAAFLGGQGAGQEARQYLVQALDKDPGNVPTALKLASLLEANKVGSGVAFLEKRLPKIPQTAENLAALAAWCKEAGLPRHALTFAGKADAVATTDGERRRTSFLLGSLLLETGQGAAAVEAFRRALAAAGEERAKMADALMPLAEKHQGSEFACFLVEALASVAGPPTVQRARTAALSSLRCGNPAPALLAAYVKAAEKPSSAFRELMALSFTRKSIEALLAVLEERGELRFDDPGLEGHLILLYASADMPDKAAQAARRYMESGKTNLDEAMGLVRSVLLLGSTAAAVELLQSLWGLAALPQKEDSGLLYAALLVSLGKGEDSLKVIRELGAQTGRSAYYSAAGASLLIDGGLPGLAEQLCLEALANPQEKTDEVESGFEPAPEGEEDVTPAEPPDGEGVEGALLRALQESTRDAFQELLSSRNAGMPLEEARKMLVSLLAYAWMSQGRDWTTLVEKVLPLVQPWHGEYLLGDVIQKTGGHAQALGLFRNAFDKSPARFDLFKRVVNGLTYAAFAEGRPVTGGAEPEVHKVVDRFLKARQGDPEAYRIAAAYLEGKGYLALAARLYESLAEESAADAEISLSIARSQAGLGHFDQAGKALDMALQLSGCSAETLDAAEQILDRVGRLDLMLAAVAECVTRYPAEGRLRLAHARLLLTVFGADRKDEAVSEAKRAIALEAGLLPDAAELLSGHESVAEARALVLAMLKSDEASVVLAAIDLGFRIAARDGDIAWMTSLGAQAARQGKAEARLLGELAGLYFKYNLTRQGLEKLRASAAKGESFQSLLLGIRLVSMGQTAEGLKLVKAFVQESFEGGEPAVGPLPEEKYRSADILIKFLSDAGLAAEAEEAITRILKKYPEDPRLRVALASLLLERKAFGPFLDQLGKLAAAPESSLERQPLLSLLNTLRENGRLDEAMGTLKPLCRNGPASSQCLTLLLYAAGAEGRPDEVAEWTSLALRGSDLAATQLRDLGDLMLQLGQFEAAESLLVAAASRGWATPSLLVSVHRSLARLYSATGKKDQAGRTCGLFLVRTLSDLELRKEMADNLVTYEYLEESLSQLSLLNLISPEDPDVGQQLFSLLLRTGKKQEAGKFALATALQSDRQFNLLVGFAALARKMLAFDVAFSLYETAYGFDPTNEALLFALAELALVLDREGPALSYFQKYIGDGPGAERRTREVVQNLCKYNRLGRAEELADRVKDSEALLQVGMNFLRARKPEKGTKLVLKGIELAGTEAPRLARELLSDMVVRPRFLPADLSRKLVEVGCAGAAGSFAACGFFKAEALLAGGKTGEALKAFGAANEGTNETWHFTLAAFRDLLRQGWTEEAARLLENVMKGYDRAQVLGEALRTLFDLLEEEAVEQGTRDKTAELARRYVTELLKRDPYDFWFRTQLAEVELLAGNGKKARAMYEGFLARTPWEPGLLNNFAYLLSKLGSDLDRGLTMVKQALEREPSHSPFYLDTEGWLLFRKGQLQEAESRIAQALARSHLGFGESLSESLYHLGVVRAERGNREEATLAFQVASFVDPYGEYGDLARRELLRLGRDPYQ